MSLRNAVAITGVGSSRIGVVHDRTGLGLAAEAAKNAVADAGISWDEIDGLLTAYSMSERYFMLGSVMCEYLGITPKFAASMVVGGASPGVMVNHAAMAIASGECSTVLIVIGENRRTGLTTDEAVAALTTVGHPNFENPYGPTLPALYGLVARRHMYEFGTTPEQLASVAVNTRYHASLNPSAQMRELITVEDVLESRYIADPLHLLDCCLISDAAGAIIVTRAERADDMATPPVFVRGIAEHHTHEHVSMATDLVRSGAEVSSRAAYAMAGVSPAEFDLALLYDCFTVVPLIEMEDLGLVGRGEAGAFFQDGHAKLGGRLPVNTHGGMLSHAHAGASGGLFDIIEACSQLRGDCGERQVRDAELAVVHVEGGVLSSHCTLVLANSR